MVFLINNIHTLIPVEKYFDFQLGVCENGTYLQNNTVSLFYITILHHLLIFLIPKTQKMYSILPLSRKQLS